MEETTTTEWQRAVVRGYVKLLQGNPVNRLIVRPTLLDQRIEVGMDFWKKVSVSRGMSRLFMS